MSRHSLIAALGVFLAAALTASSVWADLILALPSRGQVPGNALASSLEMDTRYVLLEMGHQLVPPDRAQPALAKTSNLETVEAFRSLAKETGADWVVLPSASPAPEGYRLELTAFQASSGRVESVARDIGAGTVHAQIREMAEVLLRPKGVGTAALPWETPRSTRQAPAQQPAASSPAAHSAPEAEPSWRWFGAAGLGVLGAVSRPEQAAGSQRFDRAGRSRRNASDRVVASRHCVPRPGCWAACLERRSHRAIRLAPDANARDPSGAGARARGIHDDGRGPEVIVHGARIPGSIR